MAESRADVVVKRLSLIISARREELGLDDNEMDQLGVYLAAFGKFIEREEEYHSLWKEYGALDSAGHLKSKALRMIRRVETALQDATDPTPDLDDAVDAINYAVFVIRNVREGRLG